MSDLDLIEDKVSIVDLVLENVKLAKSGRNFKALCPFHSEKTPSFVVSPERQRWRCFGCSRGGDVFTFLMEMEHLSFLEALKILAKRAGVTLTSRPQSTESEQLKEKLMAIHELAAEYYYYLLTQHKVGERARKYLTNRGINQALIKTFSLGFAPESWANLYKFLTKKGFKNKELEMSGLVISGQHGYYDRFRARIIFPLKNYRAETIGFSGRLLDSSIKEGKYINSPETLIYHKSNHLYALDVTRDHIRKQGETIVVEGEFDVISSFQAGVTNVVAIKGTALTEGQLTLLKRFTEKLVLALDADLAGNSAMKRGIELAEKLGFAITVAQIPQGKDPDEAARSSPVLWKTAIKKAIPIYDFFIESALKKFDPQNPYDKRKFGDELLPVLARIDNTIVQTHYLKKIADILSLPLETIMTALQKKQLGIKNAPFESKETRWQFQPEEHLLSLVLQAKNIQDALNEIARLLDITDLENRIVRQIFMKLIDFMDHENNINLFARQLPDELMGVFDKVLLQEALNPDQSDKTDQEIGKVIKIIKKQLLQKRLKDLTLSLKTAEKEESQDKVKNITVVIQKLTDDLRKLN